MLWVHGGEAGDAPTPVMSSCWRRGFGPSWTWRRAVEEAGAWVAPYLWRRRGGEGGEDGRDTLGEEEARRRRMGEVGGDVCRG